MRAKDTNPINRSLVVCIGNALAADDAVGPRVFDALHSKDLPKEVRVVLLGTQGIALLDELRGENLLVVVDAVRFGGPAGTLYLKDQAALKPAGGMPVTSHDIGLSEVLEVGKQLYPEKMPGKTVLVGIEGACFDALGAPLSPAVEAALGPAVDAVVEAVGQVDAAC